MSPFQGLVLFVAFGSGGLTPPAIMLWPLWGWEKYRRAQPALRPFSLFGAGGIEGLVFGFVGYWAYLAVFVDPSLAFGALTLTARLRSGLGLDNSRSKLGLRFVTG